MRKEEKAQIIESIAAQIQETPNFYITDISGLNAEQTTKLRRECFEKGIKLVVVKNTLLHKALENMENGHGQRTPRISKSRGEGKAVREFPYDVTQM